MSRSLFLAALIALSVLMQPFALPPAAAHPLGNFTVNRYSRVEVGAGSVRVFYVLDIAEIPAFQERLTADTDHDGTVSDAEWEVYKASKIEALRRGLELTVDGTQVRLEVERSAVSTPPGQANLSLIRVEAWFRSDWSVSGEHRAALRDRNEPSRIGWREMVVQSGPGVNILSSTAPAKDVSDELRSYPEDLLQIPLDRREATWVFTAEGSAVAPLPTALTTDVFARPADAFTSLITAEEINVGVVLLALLTSALLGGIHAASPGHGKTVMAAYIVGTRGTLRHALALALSVTASHTAGVLFLGAITLFASSAILPEQLYPWLTLASGVVVLVIAFGLLLRAVRLRDLARYNYPQDHDHDTQQHHRHHGHAQPISWRNLCALGLAGGIVPSASALVVLLSAIALGRLGFGLLLIVAFGTGMAIVLIATGVLIVYAGRLMEDFFPKKDSPFLKIVTRVVPLVSAGVMLLVGVGVTIQALGQFGLLWS